MKRKREREKIEKKKFGRDEEDEEEKRDGGIQWRRKGGDVHHDETCFGSRS